MVLHAAWVVREYGWAPFICVDQFLEGHGPVPAHGLGWGPLFCGIFLLKTRSKCRPVADHVPYGGRPLEFQNQVLISFRGGLLRNFEQSLIDRL